MENQEHHIQDAVEKLSNEFDDARQDRVVDEAEKEKIMQARKKILDFLSPVEENQHEIEQRQKAFVDAIREIASSRQLTENWLYAFVLHDEFQDKLIYSIYELNNKVDDYPPFVCKEIAKLLFKDSPEVFLEEYCETENSEIRAVINEVFIEAYQNDPQLSLQLFIHYPQTFEKDSVLGNLFRECLQGGEIANSIIAFKLLKHYSEFLSEAEKQSMITLVAKESPLSIFKLLSVFRNGEISEDIIVQAAFRVAADDPSEFIDSFLHYIKNQEAKENALMICARTNPNSILTNTNNNVLKDFPLVLDEANRILALSQEDNESMDINTRDMLIEQRIVSINPYYTDVVQKFLESTGISLTCTGMIPGKFVLVNSFTGTDVVPFRIEISYNDLQSANSANDLFQIFMQKKEKSFDNSDLYELEWAMENETRSFLRTYQKSDQSTEVDEELSSSTLPRLEPKFDAREQAEVWKMATSFDLPSNQTAVMFAMEPGSLSGVERDFAHVARYIYGEKYNTSIGAVALNNVQEWQKYATGIPGMPAEVAPPTAAEISRLLEQSLVNAVNEHKEMFVFHYMAHGGGGTNQRFRSNDAIMPGQIALGNEALDTEEFAKIISKEVNGKPLCSLIDITIIAESCYSGAQLEHILAYLKENNIPVKNLRIIAEANLTPATGEFTPDIASTVNERKQESKEAGENVGGAFSYYLDYYYQMIDKMRADGKEVNPPAGTFGHAIQFADLMSRHESVQKQDLRAYHYSTESNIDQHISSIDRNNNQQVA